MGKVIASEFVTLDGVMEDPGGAGKFERGDRSTITIHWEKSSDGSIWEPDLDLTYTKVR
jgi:hypothetical protein